MTWIITDGFIFLIPFPDKGVLLKAISHSFPTPGNSFCHLILEVIFNMCLDYSVSVMRSFKKLACLLHFSRCAFCIKLQDCQKSIHPTNLDL